MSYNKNPGFLLITVSLVGLLILSATFSPTGPNSLMSMAEKKTDILFLKGKFILKDKKGSIVIADDKKCCECPHHHFR